MTTLALPCTLNLFQAGVSSTHQTPKRYPTSITLGAISVFFWQDKWLSKATQFLFKEANMYEAFANGSSLEKQIESTLGYTWWICPQNNIDCLMSMAMGQNLESMFTKLKIQNESVNGNIFYSNSTYLEFSSGTYFCVRIDIAREGYSSQSGVGNGIETIIDLETYDNGDTVITGDGADIQVMDRGEYSLAQLKGFSVSPGFAVQVHIRPKLYSITEQALQKFDYLERNCVEPSVDKELNNLYGMHGNYTLSNCLVSATLTHIHKR